MVPFYVGQDLGSQQTTAALKRPSGASGQHAEAHGVPSLATSHLAVKPSSALATFDYSLAAETPACPYLKTMCTQILRTPVVGHQLPRALGEQVTHVASPTSDRLKCQPSQNQKHLYSNFSVTFFLSPLPTHRSPTQIAAWTVITARCEPAASTPNTLSHALQGLTHAFSHPK